MTGTTTFGVLPGPGPWDPDPLGFDAGSPAIPPIVPDDGMARPTAPPPPSVPRGPIPATALALTPPAPSPAATGRPKADPPRAAAVSGTSAPAGSPKTQAKTTPAHTANAKTAPAQATGVQPPLSGPPAEQLRLLAQRYGVKVPHGADIARYQPAIVRAVIRAEARRLGIPERVALGVSGHESAGWQMWTNVAAGNLQRNANQIRGRVVSTDWGVMQINDVAHPRAFPQVQSSLEANVRYGLQFLKAQHGRYQGALGHGMGDWDKALAAYNLGHAPQTPNEHAIAKRYVQAVSQWAERGRQD